MYRSIVSAALLCLVLVASCFAIESRKETRKGYQPWYSIDQRVNADGAYLILRDSKTPQTLTIVADRWLPHVAFYDAYSPGVYPRLAISSQGLQIQTKDGRLRFIDIDELASLDKGKPIDMRK